MFSCKSGVAVQHDDPEAWFNRGNTCLVNGDYVAAEKCFRRTLSLAPESIESLLNLGYVLDQLGRSEEALRCYDSVLGVSPVQPKARFNRAAHLLRSGDLRTGFADYEFRFAAVPGVDNRSYSQPRWDGSPLLGRSILVYCEQGLGDALMFARYIPLLAKMGGRVTLEVQPQLVSLMSGLEGVEQVVVKSGIPQCTDVHIPLLSLPNVFQTTLDTIPNHTPYLMPSGSLVSIWNDRVKADSDNLRIGLVWAGKLQPYPNRSCPPEYLEQLFCLPGFQFFSLQVGEQDRFPLPQLFSEKIVDLTDMVRDFSDTASLILTLDLVITIDTAVAHLAGALGKPVWVMLPHSADWRWMSDRNDSPWYPSMRLFRQTEPGNWHSVVAELAQSLGELLLQGQASVLSEVKQAALFRSALQSLEGSDPTTAIPKLRTLLTQDGDDPAIWFNLGRAYDLSGQLKEAELCYRQALVQKPDSAAIWFGLANILLRNDDFAQAELCMQKAHLYAPESLEILFALNATLISQNKSEETLHNCQKILSLKPDSIEAIYDISYAQLCRGEYPAGFANFEARLSIERFQIDPRAYAQPRWDGSSLEGKSILVFGEQGMGDVIQFSRYLPLVAERGGKIVFEVPPPLINLFTGMPCVKLVLAKSENPPLTDCYVQLMSLPYIFGTTLANIPNTAPYLGVNPAKVSLWQDRMSKVTELRVGLVWRGNSSQKNDKTRSCPFEELATLAGLPGVRFYSLQVGAGQEDVRSPPKGMQLSDHTKHLNDFSDTAALIANLDLVIGVDTAVIHLAGALGQPVWVLLAHIPEWRWLVNWDSSPWYPAMRLFRQEQPGNWTSVMMRIRHSLELLLAERAY